MIKKIQKIIIPIIFSTLLLLLVGFSQFGMGIGLDGQMVNCPFSNHSMSICKMNPMEHIEEWQSMFASLPVKNALSILFTFLLFIAIRNLLPRHKFLLVEIKYLYTKYLLKDNFHISNPLKEAFSRGILNPKLF